MRRTVGGARTRLRHLRRPPPRREVPAPDPAPGGVVVRVGAGGVCRSDRHARQGHDPDVPYAHTELLALIVAGRLRPQELRRLGLADAGVALAEWWAAARAAWW